MPSMPAEPAMEPATAVDDGESVALMEPMLLAQGSPHRGPLTDLAVELAARAAGLPPQPAPRRVSAALADLVRAMNCYYSNLIEGHDTHPVDIERALRHDYSADPRTRNLQMEAAGAHRRAALDRRRRAGRPRRRRPRVCASCIGASAPACRRRCSGSSIRKQRRAPQSCPAACVRGWCRWACTFRSAPARCPASCSASKRSTADSEEPTPSSAPPRRTTASSGFTLSWTATVAWRG